MAITVTVPPVEGASWPSGSSPTLGWSALRGGRQRPVRRLAGRCQRRQQVVRGRLLRRRPRAPRPTRRPSPPSASPKAPTGWWSTTAPTPASGRGPPTPRAPARSTITAPAMAITVTVPPAEGASWPSGSSPTLGWSVSSAVDSGQFGVWLVDASRRQQVVRGRLLRRRARAERPTRRPSPPPASLKAPTGWWSTTAPTPASGRGPRTPRAPAR